MTLNEAIKRVYNSEHIDMYIENPFLTYSVLRDLIGNFSYESKDILSCFFEIARKLNILQILKVYGSEEAKFIFENTYFDLFTDIDKAIYLDTINEILSTELLNKNLDKNIKKNELLINKKEEIIFDKIDSLKVHCTIGELKIKYGDSFNVTINSKYPDDIKCSYLIKNKDLELEFIYKKKKETPSSVEIEVPEGLNISYLDVGINNFNSCVDINSSSVQITSQKGNISYSGISKKCYISSQSGIVNYYGISDFISIDSKIEKCFHNINQREYFLDKINTQSKSKLIAYRK